MLELTLLSLAVAASGADIAAEVRGWAVAILVFVASIIGSVYAGRSMIRNRREAEANASRNPTPPTTQQVWERLDRLEKVLRSAVAVLDEVVEQLPPGFVPATSRQHVAILQEAGYLPDRLVPPVH